jgi:hypothetical protein
LLARKDEALLVGRDALLVLDLRLDVLDGVRGLDLERDRLAYQREREALRGRTGEAWVGSLHTSQRLDEDLHRGGENVVREERARTCTRFTPTNGVQRPVLCKERRGGCSTRVPPTWRVFKEGFYPKGFSKHCSGVPLETRLVYYSPLKVIAYTEGVNHSGVKKDQPVLETP